MMTITKDGERDRASKGDSDEIERASVQGRLRLKGAGETGVTMYLLSVYM